MADNLKTLLSFKNSTETAVHLYIYGDIVTDWYGAWSDADQYPEAIRKFVDRADGREIIIHMNSGGGNIFAGIAIYHTLKNYKGKKTAYIESLSASISAIIPFAADKVVMYTGSEIMVHRPTLATFDGRNSDELRTLAEALDVLEENIVDILCLHTKEGVTREQIAEMVANETWLGREEAAKIFNVELEDAPCLVAHASEYLEKTVRDKSKLPSKEPENKAELNNLTGSDVRSLSIDNKQNSKGEKASMDLKELKAKHPELVAEIENNARSEGEQKGYVDGACAERSRIKEIEQIEARISDKELLNEAKFGEKPMNAKDLAFSELERQARVNTTSYKNMMEDAEKSGAEEVKPVPADTEGGDDTADFNNKVALIAGTARKETK